MWFCNTSRLLTGVSSQRNSMQLPMKQKKCQYIHASLQIVSKNVPNNIEIKKSPKKTCQVLWCGNVFCSMQLHIIYIYILQAFFQSNSLNPGDGLWHWCPPLLSQGREVNDCGKIQILPPNGWCFFAKERYCFYWKFMGIVRFVFWKIEVLFFGWIYVLLSWIVFQMMFL